MLADWLEQTLQLGGAAGQSLRDGDPDLAGQIDALYRARDGRHPRLVELIARVRRAEHTAGEALSATTELVTVLAAELQQYAERQRQSRR